MKAATRWQFWVGFLVLVAAGVFARLWFAERTFLVNDEQAFVYDGFTWNFDSPTIWKSVVLATLEGAFLHLVGFSDLLTPRLLIIAAGVLSALLLGAIGRELGGRTVGWTTVVVALLFPTVAAHSSLVLSEQLLPLPVLAATLLVLRARRRGALAARTLLAASVLIGLATLTRFSGIFWLLSLAILVRTRDLRAYGRRLVSLVAPLLVAAAVFALVSPWVLEDVRRRIVPREYVRISAATWQAKLWHWRAIVGSAFPLLAGVGLALGSVARWWTVAAVALAGALIVAFLPPFVPWNISPVEIAPPLVTAGMVILWAVGRNLPGGLRRTATVVDLLAFFLPPLVAYTILFKTNDKYLAEFVPALVLWSGFGLARVVEAFRTAARPVAALICTVLVMIFVGMGYHIRTRTPYAGTLSFAAVEGAAAAVRELTEPSDDVFAAAVLVPVLADRRLAGDISRAAAEDPIYLGRPNPHFAARLDPIVARLERREISVVVTEKLFDDTYRRYPPLAQALERFYTLARTIEDARSSPILIWRARDDLPIAEGVTR